jgi:uncharacterized protein YndB with AHSA1/START domain
MAETVSVTRDVAAPPQVVWELVSDVTRMGEWSPETTGARWRGGADGPAVGARFSGSNRIGWRRWSTPCTVTAADPGRRFAFDVGVGPVAVATWAYDIEPTDAGCRVTETWVDRRAPVVATLTGLVVGVADRAEHNRAGMATTLERLAEAAEDRSAT